MQPQDFVKLKAAGKITCEGKMCECRNTDEEGKEVISQERDVDAVLVKRPVYDPDTGLKTGDKEVEFSISGAKKDRANLAAQLAALDEMITELEKV